MTHSWPGKTRTVELRIFCIILFLLVIPLAALVFSGMNPALLGPVIGATLLLQAGAVGIVSISGHPVVHYTGIVSVGFAFILIEFEILDALSTESKRVAGWIARVDEKARKLTLIERYGVYTLVPLMWIPGIGLYGGVIIAWIFDWNRRQAIALLATGWLLACSAVLLFVLGLLRYIF